MHVPISLHMELRWATALTVNITLPETSPLWNMENILITPHIAGPSFGGNAEVQDMIWNICMENLERYVNGKELKNIVRLKDGY